MFLLSNLSTWKAVKIPHKVLLIINISNVIYVCVIFLYCDNFIATLCCLVCIATKSNVII